MFRDESSKVIQKAHAQWGTAESPAAAGSNSSSATPETAPSAGKEKSSGAQDQFAATVTAQQLVLHRLHRKVEPNMDQRGLHFYIDRYLMNHPDSPRTPDQIAAYCTGTDATQNVMIAVGLAGMSNLLGNKSMSIVARSKYVTALKQTGRLIAAGPKDLGIIAVALRGIITLALFEVVQGKGSKKTAGSANLHINGAIALLRSVLPVSNAPNGGARGILQLMFSMFIPSQMTETPLPLAFFEALKMCRHLLEGCMETCCVDLALAIAQLLRVLPVAEHTKLSDKRPSTDEYVQQLVFLQSTFDTLEAELLRSYPFKVHKGKYPPEALFRGQWHTYSEIWGARIWNHYRWARILLNQALARCFDNFPMSSSMYTSTVERTRCYLILEAMAEDILVSVPSHWHHPILDNATARKFEATGQGGSGAVGLPSLLWHLNVAGCAPNVSPEIWTWSHAVLQVVWKDMGMQHALALAEVMESHRDKLEREALDRMVKVEEENEQ
ncbi:hypothetical protein F4778DRAFT_766106 [Xylariomycetidae sp. FL2044]|nr:hypothetical protein F4778DRAFT_766106 [Xylariomycetidae sp. FL2044]